MGIFIFLKFPQTRGNDPVGKGHAFFRHRPNKKCADQGADAKSSQTPGKEIYDRTAAEHANDRPRLHVASVNDQQDCFFDQFFFQVSTCAARSDTSCFEKWGQKNRGDRIRTCDLVVPNHAP